MHELILVFFISRFFLTVLGDVDPNHSTICDQLTCKIDEQCVTRKFWCDYTPCPIMTYCSKSQKESLRGPETCKSVLCPDGYKCILRVHECSWNQGCKEHLARCVSEVELAEEPASCVNINCGKGHRCVLREMHYCPRPPCRLTKSCAYSEDVEMWFDKCRQLGCHSEHECFLRRPPEKCATSSCGHIPDCLVTPNASESTSSKHCYGWICPSDQVCSARLQAPCSSPGANCPILRSCSYNSRAFTQREDVRTTLTDLERDIFLEEQRRLQQYFDPSFISNSSSKKKTFQQLYDGISMSNSGVGHSRKNAEDAASAPMKSVRASASPIMRSTSQHGDSAWLTYLKRRAGAEAVQYWIDKAKSNQDYEGFIEWLNMVEQLLDPDTYRLWLLEVQSASANVPEFQAWIPSRNLGAHRVAPAVGFPTPRIVDRAKNLFSSDKSLGLPDHRQKAELQGASRQSPNFKFNEGSQLGDGPAAHLEIASRPRAPLDLSYGLSQDFGEAVKNSWKSWQSYYQLNPSSLAGFTRQVANADTEPRQNSTGPQVFFLDDRYAATLKQDEDVAARSLGATMEHFKGFEQFQQQVAKLHPDQAPSQLMLLSAAKSDDTLPNLLIYFPPPLNFFIYYTVRSPNQTLARNVSLPANNGKDHDSSSEVGPRMFNSKVGSSFFPQDYDDKPDFYNKTGVTDKQKEFEFIRKIIRELINYWDDEEQTMFKSQKTNTDEVGVRMGFIGERPLRLPSVQSGKVTKSDNEDLKPTFDTFLEWLVKNGHLNSTQLSSLNSRRKKPEIYEEPEKRKFSSDNPIDSENDKNATSGKIRILVDMDKNSEIVKKLFSSNNNQSWNNSDTRQYQVTVNLNDYVDPQEEDFISKKLINIASKQLHRNVSGDQKMPKVLWVFPVYENEDNETIMNEIKKRSKEKMNTSKVVDTPVDDTSSNYSTPKTANNAKGTINQSDHPETADNGPNTEDSPKDANDEYYDDQDMYNEDDYEPNVSYEQTEGGSS